MMTKDDVRCPYCNHMLYKDIDGQRTEVVNTEMHPNAYFEKDVKCERCGRKYGLVVNKRKLVA